MKTIAIAACAAVLAGAGGIAISQAGDSTTAKSTTQSGQPGGMPGQAGQGGPDLSALAEDLDVSESKLQSAMQAARPSDPSAGGGMADMAATLADELGLSTPTVQKALEANAPSAAPPTGGAPSATTES